MTPLLTCLSMDWKTWVSANAAKHPFIEERNTAPGGKLPLNTNGGGLSYMHSGMYGMYAMQESVRQVRGVAPAQVPDVNISLCLGVGGMFEQAGVSFFMSLVFRLFPKLHDIYLLGCHLHHSPQVI